MLCLLTFLLVLCFCDRVSLCSLDWPGTHCVDLSGLKIHLSLPFVLGLKEWVTKLVSNYLFIYLFENLKDGSMAALVEDQGFSTHVTA